MMLFSGLGHQLGMLSGGCLESDIHNNARRVIQSGQATTLTYDGNDEDDVSFQLGIGCGGTVHILLQPITQDNEYLNLGTLYETLLASRGGSFHQLIPTSSGAVESRFIPNELDPGSVGKQRGQLREEGGHLWLTTQITPPPHLLVVGGGIDARPVATLAHHMGWRVSVWDPRPANARREYFQTVDILIQGAASELTDYILAQGVNAAVLMSHNIRLDADALTAIQPCSLSYLAVLGPHNRLELVLAEANLSFFNLSGPLAGPAGLNIGAELPETIALSIIAECQAALTSTSASSFSGILT
jgi:xanthine dehydrogenase accessory factor